MLVQLFVDGVVDVDAVVVDGVVDVGAVVVDWSGTMLMPLMLWLVAVVVAGVVDVGAVVDGVVDFDAIDAVGWCSLFDAGVFDAAAVVLLISGRF